MDAFEILVIILSIVLAIFLVLAVVAVSMLIKLLKKAEKYAEQADHIIANIDSASSKFKQMAAPAAAVTAVSKFINHHRG